MAYRSFGRTLFAGAAALGLLAGMEGHAAAAPTTYDFKVTATTGPLAGASATGSFTFDSASITPGASNPASDLLADLSFTFGGVSYTEATANTGTLTFNLDGSLQSARFGSDCFMGGCGIPLNEVGFIVSGAGFSYSNGSALGFGTTLTTPAPVAVPEPASALLLGVGLLALATVRRRAVSDSGDRHELGSQGGGLGKLGLQGEHRHSAVRQAGCRMT